MKDKQLECSGMESERPFFGILLLLGSSLARSGGPHLKWLTGWSDSNHTMQKLTNAPVYETTKPLTINQLTSLTQPSFHTGVNTRGHAEGSGRDDYFLMHPIAGRPSSFAPASLFSFMRPCVLSHPSPTPFTILGSHLLSLISNCNGLG